MKLLDLQTGKYLELEKDFYYGGNGVMIHSYTDEELTVYEELPDFTPHQYISYDLNDDTKYKKTLKNGFDEIIDNDTATVKLWIEYKSEPPLELKEICEKVGAVVYGGRYVLFLDQEMGSVYNIKNEYRGEEFIDYKCKNGVFSSGYNIYNNDIITFLGNIFEEHSKQLHNEPNKFEELKQYFK